MPSVDTDAAIDALVQSLIERGERQGKLEGNLQGKREALVRLLERAGISLTFRERARIDMCTDTVTFDRWIDNLLGAKTSTDVFPTFPPFAQALIDRGERKGKLDGKLEGKREMLLRLVARARIFLTRDDLARVKACTDAAILDRWLDNVLIAKTADDVLR